MKEDPFMVETYVNGNFKRCNFFNTFEQARTYVFIVMTKYERVPNSQFKIFNMQNELKETIDWDDRWDAPLTLTNREAQTFLPPEIVANNLKRNFIYSFNVRFEDYDPYNRFGVKTKFLG